MNRKQKIDIAIVDDHFLYKKGLKIAFSYYDNINVLFDADNGLHLLDQLTTAEPQLILLDLQMQIMDGVAVLPEIKSKYPQIKVIILSINSEEGMVAKLRELGADSYLSKTADPRKMYREILQVMSNGPEYNAN